MRFQNFIPRADRTTVLLPETQTKEHHRIQHICGIQNQIQLLIIK